MRSHAGSWTPWLSAVRVGVARCDVSPPIGTPSRNWAASVVPVNTGQHRPLTATAIAMASDEGGRTLLVSLDLGWWRRAQDEMRLRSQILVATELASEALLIHL